MDFLASLNAKHTKKTMFRLSTKKSILATILDSLLVFACFSTLCFLYAYFKTQNKFVSFVLGFVFGSMIIIVIAIWKNIRLEKFAKLKIKQLYEQSLLRHLMLLDTTLQLNLIKNHFYPNKHCQFKSDTSNSFYENENYYSFISQHYEEDISATQILNIIKHAKLSNCKTLTVFSTSCYSEKAKKFCETENFYINITLCEQSQLLLIAKKQNAFRDCENEIEKSVETALKIKRKRRNVFESLLDPTNIKRYAFCAGVFSFYSMITKFKSYYIVFSFVCVALCVLCCITFFLKKSNNH